MKFGNDKPFITASRIRYLISKRDQALAYKSKNKYGYKYYRNKVTYEIKKETKNFYNERVKIGNTKQWCKNVKQICNLNE